MIVYEKKTCCHWDHCGTGRIGNDILHSYREYIVGRMGVPYRQRDMSVISVIVDGPNDVISSMSGKLGMVDGVTSKAVYATK